jgi:two-component system nitrogen regulation sensor histidine kinase NtrY
VSDTPGWWSRRSLAGSLLALAGVLVLLAAGVAAGALALADRLELAPRHVALVVLLGGLPLAAWLLHRWLRPVAGLLAALGDALQSFRDGDFSVHLRTDRRDELGALARLHNAVVDQLREERSAVRQRELMLAAALDESPLAILLVNPLERIVYANREARLLLGAGRPLLNTSFGELLEGCPAQMRELLAAQQDGVFGTPSARSQGGAGTAAEAAGENAPERGSPAGAGEPVPRGADHEEAEAGGGDTYHLVLRRFVLNRQPHRLVLVRRITAELARQEAEIWKRVIRIMTHELNNSLAPISSLLHSVELILARPDRAGRADEAFRAVRERVEHLGDFLGGYARFARLPRPQLRTVDWRSFLADTASLSPFRVEGELPAAPGRFDPTQLQQVLLNLLKNAEEASDGEPDVAVRVVEAPGGGHLLQVLDRGRGLSAEELTHALLPFYSTKRTGTGLGLALCREIVEAHGGRIALQVRDGGGTLVSCWLPAHGDEVSPVVGQAGSPPPSAWSDGPVR